MESKKHEDLAKKLAKKFKTNINRIKVLILKPIIVP